MSQVVTLEIEYDFEPGSLMNSTHPSEWDWGIILKEKAMVADWEKPVEVSP